MKVKDILSKMQSNNSLAVSFEFFPPKTEKASLNLFEAISDLEPLKPAYVSVTYGAGGSSQKLTRDLIVQIKKKTNLCVVAHLTCVGQSRQEIHQVLEQFDQEGIHNILALRGDPPKGQKDFEPHPDGFEYAADLVAYIKARFPHMGIGVAGFPEGHPDCPNRMDEMDHLKAKVDAGADYICTQMFFDNRDFYDFRDRCELAGINVPIVAGLMPITSRKGVRRMSELALGCRFPAKLMKALSRADNDEAVARVGVHWATKQVMGLLENGVSGIHFYTLNKSKAALEVYRSLGVGDSESLSKVEPL